VSDPTPRLVKKVLFLGSITAVSGLHIGGSEVGLRIGGADKVVVRNPQDNAPYIPGSSLKGKMRSLLERAHCAPVADGNPKGCDGFVTERSHGPCQCGQCTVCQVFGIAVDQKRQLIQSSRLLVRDLPLINHEQVKRMANLATDFTELKTEVAIDRLTSAANPRNFERVPAGSKFSLELLLNLFEQDPEEKFVELILEGLRLVAYDALGGQSSRGYGRVRLEINHRLELKAECFRSEEALKEGLRQNQMKAPLIWPVEDLAAAA